MNFYKYQGTGNDFVLLNDFSGDFDTGDEQLIKTMCHRRFGIGADGLILLRSHATSDFEMVYFNADGILGSMCGNGGRCAVKLAWEQGIIGQQTNFTAPDGNHRATVLDDGWISLKMNDVESVQNEGETWILDTGSPHYVSFTGNIDEKDVLGEGQSIRYSQKYRDKGINVNFVQAMDEYSIAVRTYERGVEAETYSCGTGVIAAAIAAFFRENPEKSEHQTQIHTKGGTLEVRFSVDEHRMIRDVWLSGPAEKVFEGAYEV